MSESEAIQVNLDTSVLINYVYTSLPGEIERERGSTRLIDDDEFWTAIGGKANQEFEALCERRYDLYADVVEFLLEDDGSIFDYDPRNRDIHTSDNDRSHFREEIQMSWHDRDKREQLSLLRRVNQDLQLYQHRLPNEILDKRYPQQENEPLLQRLETELGVAHDCEILVDAAEIADRHAVKILAALDSDITGEEHRGALSNILADEYGDADLLSVAEPDEL
jgi:hypothetical protein